MLDRAIDYYFSGKWLLYVALVAFGYWLGK